MRLFGSIRCGATFAACVSLLPVVAVAQPHSRNLKSIRLVEPDRIARIDHSGRIVGPIVPYPKREQRSTRNVATFVAAYDATNTNPAMLPGFTGVHSNFYGANAGLWTFSDDYKTGPWLEDTTLAAGKAYQTATLYQITYFWNPAGTAAASGTGNLAMQINNVLAVGGATGPAQGAEIGGIVTFNDNLPSGFYTLQVDLTGLDYGLGLGPQTGGGVKVTPFGYTGTTLQNLSSQAWQMGRGNLCSPGDPNYPGTNPSSTAATYWTDDSTAAFGPFVNTPNYAFDDLLATGYSFSEFYSGDFSISGLGELSPLVGMFVNTSARMIRGTIEFENVTAGREPRIVTITVGNGTTSVDHSVALGPTGGYEILDLNGSGSGGARQVSVKADHWLRRTVSTNTSGGSVSNIGLTLHNGDIDTDDVVSVFDYIWLSDHFDLDSSSPGWNDPTGPNGIPPSFADLDRDDVVSIFDYIILSDHFDESGDPLP